ncbi:hypothetical protein BH23CHL10_BH23CHL10_13450 [soil metagenome]
MSDRPVEEQEIEQRLRAWLHGEVWSERSPATLRDRVNAIPAVIPKRGWGWHRLQSLAAIPVVAVTVVVATAVTAIGLGLVQPNFFGTPPDDTVTMEELQAAVDSAVEALIDAPGVEGYQVAYIDEYLSGASWFDSRSNGDVVVVQRIDVDVAQIAWWLNRSEGPPTTGRNIATTVWVLVGDEFYEATSTSGQGDARWSVADRDAARRVPLTLGLVLLSGDDGMFGLPADDGAITREESPDGGSVWMLTTPDRDGEGVQRWHIGPGGELRSWSWELVGVSQPMEPDTNPTTSWRMEFTALADPDPIQAPTSGEDLELTDFALPEDFPLGSGSE